MVTIDSVRAVAEKLPRSYEVVVCGLVKFRVGQIDQLASARDETVMGFAFPKEERNWLIGGSADRFMLPGPSDLRFNWVLARMAALDEAETRNLVPDAWRMVVPKRVAATHGACNRLTSSAIPSMRLQVTFRLVDDDLLGEGDGPCERCRL